MTYSPYACARAHPGQYDSRVHPSILKKRIAVEDLLVWAYRDQMVHVAVPEEALLLAMGGGGSLPAGYGNGFTVEAIDGSPGGAFSAAPDAFAVHEVIKGLARVHAHLPADVVGKVDTMALSATVLPDVRRGFVVRRSELVMANAIDGKRPDWVPSPVIRVERGETIYARRKSGQPKRDGRGALIPQLQLVRFVGDLPWDVERARLIYQLWVAALAVVRDTLARARLARYDLTDALPPARPWA